MAIIRTSRNLKRRRSERRTAVSTPIDIVDDEVEEITPRSQNNNIKKVKVSPGSNSWNAILIENYDNFDDEDDRNLELAIKASLVDVPCSSPPKGKPTENNDDDILILRTTECCQSSNTKKHKRRSWGKRQIKTTFLCGICADEMTSRQSFKIKGCCHSYCIYCIRSYLGSKLRENIINIKCPNSRCTSLVKPDHCWSFLPLEVSKRWSRVLLEAGMFTNFKSYGFEDRCIDLVDEEESSEDDDIVLANI